MKLYYSSVEMIFSFLAVFFFVCVSFCYLLFFNPLTHISVQDRISPYSIKTISNSLVMRIKTNIIRRFLVDPIPNSLNHQDLPVRGLSCWHQWGLCSSISKKCFLLFCSVILAGYAQTWLDQKQQNLPRKVQLNFYFPHIYLL